jgi:hypothetical protein
MQANAQNGVESGARDLGNLFGIYGAIDQHLEERRRPQELGRISPLLPAYGRRRPHWFGGFRDFSTKTGHADPGALGDPRSRVEAALTDLAQYKPRGRMRARRYLAISAAAQTFPDLDNRDLASAAVGRELGDDEDKDGRDLATRLRSRPPSDSQAGRDTWWGRVLGANLVPAGVGPRPCSGDLSWVTLNGDRDLVPTLKTVFDAEIRYDDARRFCDDPTTWECFPSWCRMRPINKDEWTDDVRQYQEVVSFNCADDDFPKLTINLNFHTEEKQTPPRRIVTEYWLSDPKKQPEHYVLVNQGWLEVEELPSDDYPRVRVTTTKTVKFSDDFGGGAGLASVSCRLGYLSMVGDLVTCASKGEKEKGYPDARFQGRIPEPEPSAPAPRAGTNYGWLIPLMADETARAIEEGVDEYVDATRGSYARFERGYRAGDLVQDMTDSWLRMLRQGARFADAGLRVARTAPRNGPRRPTRRAPSEGGDS